MFPEYYVYTSSVIKYLQNTKVYSTAYSEYKIFTICKNFFDSFWMKETLSLSDLSSMLTAAVFWSRDVHQFWKYYENWLLYLQMSIK